MYSLHTNYLRIARKESPDHGRRRYRHPWGVARRVLGCHQGVTSTDLGLFGQTAAVRGFQYGGIKKALIKGFLTTF